MKKIEKSMDLLIEFGKEVTGFIHPFPKCEVWIRPNLGQIIPYRYG